MKRIFLPLTVLVAACLLFASCLNSDNDDIDYYDDAAITAFTLGTLNVYKTTTAADGTQTTTKTTLTGSNYKFNIDQQKGEVYNPDSLPYGTDAKHVVVTIQSKASGDIAIKSLISDTLFYHNNSDSVDFSEPRTLVVISGSGDYRRTYNVRLNVHQEEPNEFKWTRLADNASLAALTGMKAVETAGSLWVMGTDGSAPRLYYAKNSLPLTWKEATALPVTSAEAYKSLTACDGRPCTLDGQTLVVAETGADGALSGFASYTNAAWPPLARLLGAHDATLYALGTDGALYAAPLSEAVAQEDGCWQQQPLDSPAALLPTADISFVSTALKTNEGAARLFLMGTLTGTAGVQTVAWSRIVETTAGAQAQPWSFYETDAESHYKAPCLDNMQVVSHDDGLLAMGGRGKGATSAAAFSQFYKSLDGGITWRTDTLVTFPATAAGNFASSATSFALLRDTGNYLWLFCGQTGQVWRGRLNKLGWLKED